MGTDTTTNRQAAIETLRELITQFDVAMLTTIDNEQQLRSRPMLNINREFDGELWFLTEADDPKVTEIEANAAVNLSFTKQGNGQFVSVSGDAAVVHDAKRVEILWNKECERWFPNGPADPNLALLRVEVNQAEYWDGSRNAMVAIAGAFKRLVDQKPQAQVVNQRLDWEGESAEE